MRTIRLFLLTGALLALPWTVTLPPQSPITHGAVAFAAPPEGAPAPKAEPDVVVKLDGGEKRTVFFANPIVLAAGVIAGIVVIAFIAMAARGGGTTIIREK